MGSGRFAERQDVIELQDQPPSDNVIDELLDRFLDQARLRIILMDAEADDRAIVVEERA